MYNHKPCIADVDVRSQENNLAHRTREIDRERLIVRRGQPFSMTLQYCDPLPSKHRLELVLHLGRRDEVTIKVQESRGAAGVWWFYQQQVQSETILTLCSPADAAIGQYHLVVLIVSPDGHIVGRKDKINFHLLFNPWCKDDAVYLSDESLLQEYVINEDGAIYMGTWDNIQCIPWNYGQFEDFVMDICFEILDNSKNALKNLAKDIERRCDPIYVSRMITTMVNANGDRGVLACRWHEPYYDGIAPYRWTGSVPILRQWSKTGARAVKYGQCWVLAGVACTVLRCLGIPTRCITNFSSAHDANGNLSLDILLNERLEIYDESKNEEIWNFHCWVESWMRRDDLPKENDGWQVLDPTPQELSNGEYQCGPCPVRAIKEGDLEIKYDTPFIFAEVNADVVHWIIQRDGQQKKVREDQRSVGRNISTKSVYGNGREDVTCNYKYPEGSLKERDVYMKAGHQTTDPTNEQAQPQNLKLSVRHVTPVFGTDFDVIVEVRNDGGRDAYAQLTVLILAVTYNSLHRGECQRQTLSVTVPAHTVCKEVLRLHYEDYGRCVSDHRLIRVKALLEAAGENEPIMTVANIPLEMPEVLVEVPGKAMLWEKATAYISFVNPLPVALKGGVFTVEGAGLLAATHVYVNGDVAPGQKVAVNLSFSPVRTGVRRLLVDFDSNRLKDVKGSATVVVRKKYSPLITGLN